MQIGLGISNPYFILRLPSKYNRDMITEGNSDSKKIQYGFLIFGKPV